MAIQMSDNFDGAPGESFLGDAHFSVTGAVALTPSHYGVGVRFAPGGGWIGQTPFPATAKRVFSRIYRLDKYPTSHSQIFQLRNTGAVCTASLRTTGQLALNNGGSIATVAAISAAPMPLDQEFRVVFAVDGTTFTATVYPDTTSTTPTQTISGAITGGSITTTREGSPNAPGGLPGANLDLIWPVDDSEGDPGLRKYVYLTTDSTSGIVPKKVTAEVHDENMPVGAKTYSVRWGDGTTSGPQAGRTFTHTFTTPGDWAMVPAVDVT